MTHDRTRSRGAASTPGAHARSAVPGKISAVCWPVQASGDHVLGRRVESACKAVQYYLSEYGFT